MRAELEAILTSRHGSLYGVQEHGQGGLMVFGFEHGDGWFPIVEGLSAVLSGHDAESGMETKVVQVKEKYGTLSFYASADGFGQGAIDLAESYSGRVSERSGLPGIPVRTGGWMSTLSPSEAPEADMPPDRPGQIPSVTLRLARHAGPGAAAEVIAARRDVLGEAEGIPDGWAELIDALAGFLSREGWRGDHIVPWRLHGLRVGSDGRLEALVTGEMEPECEGALAFASEMSSRVSPVSGACTLAVENTEPER